jgi:cysteinyl-tRNA synthetase
MDKQFQIYNTLRRAVEPLIPSEPGHLRFYSCGPTVYSYAHIGNFRSFLTADLIFRTASALGWDVSYATNVTDVGHLTNDDLADTTGEDRMIRALRSKEGERFANIWDLARYYTQVLLEDWESLNLLEPTVRPRATEHMREQILAVNELLESGHAYETDQGIYFSVASFPEYGKLSGNRDAAELEQSVRDVVQDPEKRDPRDFALWKKDDAHLMQWYSPWGWGFPGWHLECSVMAQTYLGEQIDLHAGGEDLIFPHHECEIAQAESLTGKPFAHHWVHTRFLQVEGEKMSKRAGNYYTVRDLILPESEGGRGIDPLAVRLTLLSGYYRKPFNFTFDTLKASIRHRQRFQDAIQAVETRIEKGLDDENELTPKLTPLYDRALSAMLDDLNTPEALAATYEGVRLILAGKDHHSVASAQGALEWLRKIDALLGIVFPQTPAEGKDRDDAFSLEVSRLIEARAAARASRDFASADRIRDELVDLGVEIMDTPEGTRWKRVSAID